MNETIQDTPNYDMAEAQEMALRQRALTVREPEPPNMLAVIDRAARDPNVDVDKMERLLALSEQIHARQAKAAYDQAMNDAQTEMRPVSRDCHNPQTRSRYASYEAIDNAIRPIYTKNGFAMSFGSKASSNPERVIVTARISHRMGHTEHVELEMPADGKGAKGGDVMTKTHATGSALSYGKRYIMNLVWNLSFGESDDDGNAAGGHKTQNRTPEPPAEPKTRQQATTAQIVPPVPKVATEAIRKRMLEHISPLPNAVDYAKARGFASLEEWPLDQVPVTKQGLDVIIREINNFKPMPPSTEEMPPDAIASAIITVPRRGQKRADYLKNPDTIGSLYKAMKDGDGAARTRLFGLAMEWPCIPTEGSDGKIYQPSDEDFKCRAALDAFLDWREAKEQKKSAPDRGPSMGEMTSFDYRDTDQN